MYDIKIKNDNKTSFFVGLLFFVCGLVLCGTAFYFSFGVIIKKGQFDSSVEAIKIDDNKHYEKVSSASSSSKIKRNQIMYSPSYTYVVDGIERVCKVEESYGYKVNKKYNKVYYDSKNPSDCMIEYLVHPDPLVYVVFGLSLLMPIAGLQMMTGNNKKKKMIKHLQKRGVLYKNVPYELVDYNSVSNPFTAVFVNYTTDSGKIIRLIADSSVGEKVKNNGSVDLLIDPNDYKNYYIDVNIKKL